MKKLLWFLAFIADVIIFSIVGIGTTIYTMIETALIVLVNFVYALVTFDGDEILNQLLKVPIVIFVLPIRSLMIVNERLKKCYEEPVLFRKWLED